MNRVGNLAIQTRDQSVGMESVEHGAAWVSSCLGQQKAWVVAWPWAIGSFELVNLVSLALPSEGHEGGKTYHR